MPWFIPGTRILDVVSLDNHKLFRTNPEIVPILILTSFLSCPLTLLPSSFPDCNVAVVSYLGVVISLDNKLGTLN